MRRRATLVLIAACASLSGCDRHAATLDDCQKIVDRMVELELDELGFRDPALAARKAEEARSALASDLKQCQGTPLRKGALACVARAKNTEELSHRCLR